MFKFYFRKFVEHLQVLCWLHFALDLRHVIWIYGKRTVKAWAQSEALPVKWTMEIVLQPHIHSWQSSALNKPCLHLHERIHRAFRLLNMDDEITFIPQQYQSKSLHHPLNSMLNDLNEGFFFFSLPFSHLSYGSWVNLMTLCKSSWVNLYDFLSVRLYS